MVARLGVDVTTPIIGEINDVIPTCINRAANPPGRAKGDGKAASIEAHGIVSGTDSTRLGVIAAHPTISPTRDRSDCQARAEAIGKNRVRGQCRRDRKSREQERKYGKCGNTPAPGLDIHENRKISKTLIKARRPLSAPVDTQILALSNLPASRRI